MKSIIPTLGRLLAALAVISLWLTATTAQAATKGAETAAKATVVSVVGKVLVNYGDAAPEEATLKMVLREGATINTGNNSKIVLDLGPNGSALSINANSTLVLDELKLNSTPQGPAATTTLDLKRGGLIGNTKKLSQASKYEVRTANGVAGIRGTSFRFLATGLWQCFSGLVQVSANGESFSVDPGKMLDFKAGKPSLDNIPADQLRAFIAEARMIVTLIGNLTSGFNGASIQQHMDNFNGGATGEKVDVKTVAAFEHFSQQVQVLESFVSARLAMNEGNNLLNSPIINLNNSTADIQQRFLNAGFVETAAFSNIGNAGIFRGQLSWHTSNDLDLHLVLPDGTHVYYGHTSATFADGMAEAILDHDNLGGVIDVPPDLRVENITVNPIGGATQVPSGTYQFYVHNYSGDQTDAVLRYTANGAQNVSVVNLTLTENQTSPTYTISVP